MTLPGPLSFFPFHCQPCTGSPRKAMARKCSVGLETSKRATPSKSYAAACTPQKQPLQQAGLLSSPESCVLPGTWPLRWRMSRIPHSSASRPAPTPRPSRTPWLQPLGRVFAVREGGLNMEGPGKSGRLEESHLSERIPKANPSLSFWIFLVCRCGCEEVSSREEHVQKSRSWWV